MKRLIIIVITLFLVSAVFAQETKMSRKERKAAEKAKLTERTKALVDANAWQFDANQMLPSTGKSRSLTSSYNIVVKDNQVDSYLPYFGRAYQAEYGSSESPLTFKSEITEFTVENWKKGGWIVKFKAANKNDRLDYILHIGDTGSTSLSINSSSRQPISFIGQLVEIEKKN